MKIEVQISKLILTNIFKFGIILIYNDVIIVMLKIIKQNTITELIKELLYKK